MGEQPVDTLRREVFEETSLQVSDEQLLHVRSVSLDRDGSYLAVQIVYRGVVEGKPEVVDVGGSTDLSAWVPLSELDGLPTVSLVDEVVGLVR